MRTTCAIILALLCLLRTDAFGAEFTVDDRSYLHAGASFVIGYSLNTFVTVVQDEDAYKERWKRRSFIFGVCMMPGLMKEYGMDAYADYGDIAFNAIGCTAGIALSDYQFMVVPTGNGVLITTTW